MRKRIVAIAALLMIVMCAAALAACGGSDPGGDPSGTYVMTKITPAKGFSFSEQPTLEGFSLTFDGENYTYVYLDGGYTTDAPKVIILTAKDKSGTWTMSKNKITFLNYGATITAHNATKSGNIITVSHYNGDDLWYTAEFAKLPSFTPLMV